MQVLLFNVLLEFLWVTTRNQEILLSDLAETFESLRSARIKLNPDKCVFGVPAGKLLGFLVSSRGIEANPEKIRAIERMRPPSKLMDVQYVTGCMVALSQFISRLGERRCPYSSSSSAPGRLCG